jgi:hypothetical protein
LQNPEYDAGGDPSIPAYIPTVPQDSKGDPVNLGDLLRGTSNGHSHLREYMAMRVEKRGLERRGHISRKELVADGDEAQEGNEMATD